MNSRITILAGFSFLLAAVPVTVILLETTYSSVIAGSAAIAYLGSSKLLDRKILEESTGRKTKAIQDLVETTALFLIIGSAGLTQVVPTWLGILTVGAVGAVKLFQLKMNRRYRKGFRLEVGEDYWMLLTGIVLLGSYINSYFVFYGMILVNLVVAYDLLWLVRRIER